jgi:hypothetical protein
MKRIALVAVPLATLLLSSCAWHFAPQKSDLQMAEQAAKVAGEDEVQKRQAPRDLVPGKAVLAANVGKAKPVVIVPSAGIAAPVIAPMPVSQPAAPAEASKQVLGKSTPDLLATVTPLASEPAPEPVARPSVTKDDVADAVPVNGTAIHLASYREIGAAKRGWQILNHSYHALQPLRPLYVAVEIPGKGHMLRLYGTGATTTSLKTICNELHAEGAYCSANIAF